MEWGGFPAASARGLWAVTLLWASPLTCAERAPCQQGLLGPEPALTVTFHGSGGLTCPKAALQSRVTVKAWVSATASRMLFRSAISAPRRETEAREEGTQYRADWSALLWKLLMLCFITISGFFFLGGGEGGAQLRAAQCSSWGSDPVQLPAVPVSALGVHWLCL